MSVNAANINPGNNNNILNIGNDAQQPVTTNTREIRQDNPQFRVNGKVASKNLSNAFEAVRRSVREKTEPTFLNALKNFFCRGRKASLESLQKTLNNESFASETLEKISNSFKAALDTQRGLPKATQAALRNLIAALECEPSSQLREELEAPFEEALKNNPLGKGSFGTVYSNKDGTLVFKIMNDKGDKAKTQRAFRQDIAGNEVLGKGMKNFKDNKEIFYSEAGEHITKYAGHFERKTEDGSTQKVLVFERIEGEEMGKTIEELNDNIFFKKSEIQCCDLEIAAKTKEKTQNELKQLLSRKCAILAQTAEGIAAVHEAGCINRDIKPQNTMVGYKDTDIPARDENGEVVVIEGKMQTKKIGVPYVKLIDQGLTFDMKSGEIPRKYCGTPRYMAPETMLYKHSLPASDVFSLGITLLNATCDDPNPLKDTFNEAWKNKNLGNAYFPDLPNIIDQCYAEQTTNGEKVCTQPFLRDLVTQCCSFEPKDRPSAAQVAYCLQVYQAAIEAGEEKGLDFKKVLEMAQTDRPKGIPSALREMMQSDDKEVRRKGCKAVFNLAEEDPSYQQTPSYGLALLKSGKELGFREWANKHANSLEELKNRMYVDQPGVIDMNKTTKRVDGKAVSKDGKTEYLTEPDRGVWNTKDLRVSKDEFKIINGIFPNGNANPRNMA